MIHKLFRMGYIGLRVQPIAAARGTGQTDRTDRHQPSFHNAPSLWRSGHNKNQDASYKCKQIELHVRMHDVYLGTYRFNQLFIVSPSKTATAHENRYTKTGEGRCR